MNLNFPAKIIIKLWKIGEIEKRNLNRQMLLNHFDTFLSKKSVLYLFSVIDNLIFHFAGKFQFIVYLD
jgi:hypothetical protein